MLLAFILCFSTLPMTAFAQEPVQKADVVAEQEEAEAAAAPGIVKSTGESVSDSDPGTQDTGADDEKKAAVQKVQALIDALPDVDELPTMKEDERNTAYMAIQEAYAAYDALTAEQQAQITGADCFEGLFGWFNGQVAPLEAEYITLNYGTVDEKTGLIVSWTVKRTGYQIVDSNMTEWTVRDYSYYVIKDNDNNVTLSSLTIKGRGNAYLYLLGDNPTLTINGPLTFQNGSSLYIYGPADGTGKVIINNSSDQAAIRADGESNGSALIVSSGTLEITSNSGHITDGIFW